VGFLLKNSGVEESFLEILVILEILEILEILKMMGLLW
jgi:hypothetical protein